MIINFKLKKHKEILFDLPFFVFRNNVNKSNFILKFIFLFKSHLIIFILKKFNKRIFTILMNCFFGRDGKIIYKPEIDLYAKKFRNSEIFFPNKYRILGSMVNHEYELLNLLDSYCLNNFEILENDLVVDCGANIGAMFLALELFGVGFQYIAFEPDKKVHLCLEKNIKNKKNVLIYNNSLGPENKVDKLYINSETGDSSLEKIITNETIETHIITLDSLTLNKIKLLKIDAEGSEIEVLKGGLNTLEKIEFIAVDMGPEKGLHSLNTVSEVTNFLFKNNFELLNFNPERVVGLFKNKNMVNVESK